MKRLFTIITVLTAALCAMAQGKTVQNRPYTDLRPFHFGVVVGMHLQDIEFMNVGPQIITGADGTTAEKSSPATRTDGTRDSPWACLASSA